MDVELTYKSAIKNMLLKFLTVKVIAFGIATYLIFVDKIDQFVWCAIAVSALGLREVSKFIAKR